VTVRVAAIALVGTDLDYLDRILYQWVDEGFQADGPVVDFANDLRRKLAVSDDEVVHPHSERTA
jgi:hypothetical protein